MSRCLSMEMIPAPGKSRGPGSSKGLGREKWRGEVSRGGDAEIRSAYPARRVAGDSAIAAARHS